MAESAKRPDLYAAQARARQIKAEQDRRANDGEPDATNPFADVSDDDLDAAWAAIVDEVQALSEQVSADETEEQPTE